MGIQGYSDTACALVTSKCDVQGPPWGDEVQTDSKENLALHPQGREECGCLQTRQAGLRPKHQVTKTAQWLTPGTQETRQA